MRYDGPSPQDRSGRRDIGVLRGGGRSLVARPRDRDEARRENTLPPPLIRANGVANNVSRPTRAALAFSLFGSHPLLVAVGRNKRMRAKCQPVRPVVGAVVPRPPAGFANPPGKRRCRRAAPLPNPRWRATFSVLTPPAGVGRSQALATVPFFSAKRRSHSLERGPI